MNGVSEGCSPRFGQAIEERVVLRSIAGRCRGSAGASEGRPVHRQAVTAEYVSDMCHPHVCETLGSIVHLSCVSLSLVAPSAQLRFGPSLPILPLITGPRFRGASDPRSSSALSLPELWSSPRSSPAPPARPTRPTRGWAWPAARRVACAAAISDVQAAPASGSAAHPSHTPPRPG